jgi:hypothetical protein
MIWRPLPSLAVFLVLLAPMLLQPTMAGAPAVQPAAEEATLPASWIDRMRWRSIGPANMGGRIIDLCVVEGNPNQFWAASASGGLIRTINNGVTFDHQFDRESTV